MKIKLLLMTAMCFSLSAFANTESSYEVARMNKSEVISWYENKIKPFLDKNKAEHLIGNLNFRRNIYEAALISHTFEGFYHIMMFIKYEFSLEKPVESDLLSKIVRLEWDINHNYPLLEQYKQVLSHINDLVKFDHLEKEFIKNNRKEISSYLSNNIWMLDGILFCLYQSLDF